MLGQDLAKVFAELGHEVTGTDRRTLDITNHAAVMDFVAGYRFEAIVNAAAYNFVDRVEDEQYFPLAYQINALGPKFLAEAASVNQIPFVHFSTDYVFAGNQPEGYREDDRPEPISKYGETKLAGENFVLATSGQNYVCRLSKIFGAPSQSEAGKESFVALMLRLAASQPSLKIVHEEVGCPSYTRDIAEVTGALLAAQHEPGIYHLVNEGGGVTWYEFAEEIFALADIKTPREPVPSSEFPRAAQCPKFAALHNTKLPPLRKRQEALADFLAASDLLNSPSP